MDWKRINNNEYPTDFEFVLVYSPNLSNAIVAYFDSTKQCWEDIDGTEYDAEDYCVWTEIDFPEE